MADQRFRGRCDTDLADIWYALSGAEIRHPDCFKPLVDASIHELERRLHEAVTPFLDGRFAKLRLADAPDDAVATVTATIGCPPPGTIELSLTAAQISCAPCQAPQATSAGKY